MQLNEKQVERYLHHIVLKDIGGDGQKKLLNSKVLVIGAGGLGSPAALYLAAAGIGTLGIADNDKIEISNLQRQILYSTNDIGHQKTNCAQKVLQDLNPDVKVVKHAMRITAENIKTVISEYEFIIDGSDNFETKFLINDICVEMEKIFSYGGVVGFKGQTITYVPGSLCVRCVFPDPISNSCAQDCRGQGILGTVAGVIGSIQATEAIKFVLQKGELLTNKMLSIDMLTMNLRIIELQKNKSCPTCGE